MGAGKERHISFRWSYTNTHWNGWTGVWSDNALISRLNIVLFSILFLVHLFDVWSTIVILSHGGEELNPIMMWFMVRLGQISGLIFFKSATVLLSALIVKEWSHSPALAGALSIVVVIMVDIIVGTSLPMIMFIYFR